MHFGYLFLLLLLRILATCYILVPKWKTPWKKSPPGGENTMPLKDGEAPKLHPENA